MTYFFCILQRSEFQQALKKKKKIGALKKKILVHFIKSYFQIYQNRILSENLSDSSKKKFFYLSKKNQKNLPTEK